MISESVRKVLSFLCFKDTVASHMVLSDQHLFYTVSYEALGGSVSQWVSTINRTIYKH
jgi:hypothetical protein